MYINLIDEIRKNYELVENKNEDESILVFQKTNNNVNYETFIKMYKPVYEDKWIIIEGERDQEYIIGTFDNYNHGFFALYLASLSRFKTDYSIHKAREEIRNAGSDLLEIEKILKKYVDEKYFSLNEEKHGAINLEKSSNGFNLYYLGLSGEKIPIVKDRKAPGVFVVIYNFALKIIEFAQIYNQWAKQLNLDIEQKEQFLRIYLRK